jgi:acyl-coenzyme A synthetase/AMP-(fatty) acid ligase
MFLVGFWCIFMFFGVVIPMWLTEGLAEYFGKTKKFNPEDIRRKTLVEQEGVEVIYNQPKGISLFTRRSSLISMSLLSSLNLKKVISKQNKIYLKSVQILFGQIFLLKIC